MAGNDPPLSPLPSREGKPLAFPRKKDHPPLSPLPSREGKPLAFSSLSMGEDEGGGENNYLKT